MGYCTVEEVKEAMNFPNVGAPVPDNVIESFIGYAEEEIENIYHTKFGNVEYSSTATSGDTSTITDSAATYTADEYVGYVVWVYDGTNAGEYREIQANTTTALTVSPAFSAAIDTTSKFRITKLGYKDETVDGSGEKYQYVQFQPLIKLNYLDIDSNVVTPSNVYQYQDTGRLLLSSDAEYSVFANNEPKLVNMKYVYGVYPMPQIIKRLCVLMAAMRSFTAQIAGTYDDFTSISLPGGFQGSKGEPYVNIQSALAFMQGEARGIVYGFQGDQVTANWRSQPSYRPFTIFG